MTDCGSRSTVEGAQLINWSYFETTGFAIETAHDASG